MCLKKIIKILFSKQIDLCEFIWCSHTNDKVIAGKHNYSFKTNHELIFEFASKKKKKPTTLKVEQNFLQ